MSRDKTSKLARRGTVTALALSAVAALGAHADWLLGLRVTDPNAHVGGGICFNCPPPPEWPVAHAPSIIYAAALCLFLILLAAFRITRPMRSASGRRHNGD